MSEADLAAFYALCAALASAIGNVIRQRSAQEVTDKPVGHLALFGMLLRDKRWWLGGVGDISSYCLLALALDDGSVLLVMSLQVTALLFALPVYSRFARHPVTRREWMWAVLLAAALAIVIAVGQPMGGQERATGSTWLVVALVLGPPLLLCLVGAPDLEGSSGRGAAAGGGGRFVVGGVRGADEGCRRRSRRQPRPVVDTHRSCISGCSAGWPG